MVALRKESVDRNLSGADVAPAKRVALRKESVDRNGEIKLNANLFVRSLSARRAWIEIGIGGARQMAVYKVALRKESVDRNKISMSKVDTIPSRSPQGERG